MKDKHALIVDIQGHFIQRMKLKSAIKHVNKVILILYLNNFFFRSMLSI